MFENHSQPSLLVSEHASQRSVQQKQMRVLHLITWLEPGGIEQWLLMMLQQIPRGSCAIDFCCKGSQVGSLAEKAREYGAEVFHCPLTPGHVGFVRRLTALIQDGRYDIVHNHLESYSGLVVWIARRLRVPVVTSFHNVQFAPQTWTRRFGIRQVRAVYSALSVKYALKKSQYITGCSRAVLAKLAPDYESRDNYRVLYYGVR